MNHLKPFSKVFSLILAVITVFSLGYAELNNYETATSKAKAAMTSGDFVGSMNAVSQSFQATFMSGKSLTEELNETREIKLFRYGNEFYQNGMAATVAASKARENGKLFREATRQESLQYTSEFYGAIASFDQNNVALFGLFLLKLLFGLGASAAPFLLSLFAKPVFLAGLATALTLLAVVFAQKATAQNREPVNLLKVNTAWQDGSRNTSLVLFRFWPRWNGFVASTNPGVSIGVGPTWRVADSLKSIRKSFRVTVHNIASVTHSGKSFVTYKLWNYATGSLGKFGFLSKSFINFPAWKAKPSLALSTNQLTYQIRGNLDIGWRVKNVLARGGSGWNNSWRTGLVAKYGIADRISILAFGGQIGSAPAARLELSVVF